MTYLSPVQATYARSSLERITQYQGTISTLEAAVRDYAPIQAQAWQIGAAPLARPLSYSATRQGYTMPQYAAGYLHHTAREYFTPTMFLKDGRPASPFIGVDDDISQQVTDAFEATMHAPFPDDIGISIVSKDELRQKHEAFGGEWSEGIQGFAVNRKGMGASMIFVKENELDQLLLVIGHEIGHCMSRALPAKLDEEAKAFAFELAWMAAIADRDIAGMKTAIDLDVRPANNGLHNVAFNFISRLVRGGRKAMDVFHDLVRQHVAVEVEHVR